MQWELSVLLAVGEPSTGRDVALVTLGGAAIAGVMKILEFAWNWITQNRTDKKEEQARVEGHLERRVARLEDEVEKCAKRDKRRDRRVRVLENSNTQMRAYIENNSAPNAKPYKEVPLPPEEPDEDDATKSGTDVHEPLSTATKPPVPEGK